MGRTQTREPEQSRQEGNGSTEPAIANLTPEEAFRMRIKGRVERAINAIRVVGQCADSARYQYTKEQAERVVKLLSAEVEALERRFLGAESILD